MLRKDYLSALPHDARESILFYLNGPDVYAMRCSNSSFYRQINSFSFHHEPYLLCELNQSRKNLYRLAYKLDDVDESLAHAIVKLSKINFSFGSALVNGYFSEIPRAIVVAREEIKLGKDYIKASRLGPTLAAFFYSELRSSIIKYERNLNLFAQYYNKDISRILTRLNFIAEREQKTQYEENEREKNIASIKYSS